MIHRYKTITKLILSTLVLGFMAITPAKAQFGDIGAFLEAGANDASILTREYIKPFPTGFGTGLNAGFTESAAPKKLFGFSIQLRPSVAVVPSGDQSFDISTLNLEKIRVASGENPVTQTISGSKDGGPLLEIFADPNDPNTKIGEFEMPGGTGFAFVPAPIVQASIGLIKKTDVTVRYLPETDVSDFGSMSVLGGAVKHELTQYVPGGKLLPVDVSLMVGFNQISVDANLDLQPDQNATRDPNDPALTSNPNPDFSAQEVTTTTNTFVVNALVGKSLPFISIYGGVGYQKADFELSMVGDYPVASFNPTTPQEDYNVITDPFALEIESESNVHLLGGFRLRLGILAFYGEATLANYFTANAGVGISFR
ncbi:hypothetical protein A8B79_03800 [Balneola sp. EhC07]|uniref:DUF6588 family protein n=1 Tax=Balneola sp. EhC07 TaxID=1849360 RepID=UPI0007F48988|nr:DUF6588 family protein [Balneola sp. EhC07]OAN62076.1 hypothetical protein A8B79_03800 [Balneola sp. EhC07]